MTLFEMIGMGLLAIAIIQMLVGIVVVNRNERRIRKLNREVEAAFKAAQARMEALRTAREKPRTIYTDKSNGSTKP